MGRKRKNEDNGGRVAKARGVSFPPEMSEDIDKRLGELHPFVAGLSAYVQRLVHLDLSRGLLREDGSINEAAVLKVKDAKGGRSFNSPRNAIATADAAVDNPDGTKQIGAAGRVGVVAQLVEHHNGIVSFPPEFPAVPYSKPTPKKESQPAGLVVFSEDREFSGGSEVDPISPSGTLAGHANCLPALFPTAKPNPAPAAPDLLPLAA